MEKVIPELMRKMIHFYGGALHDIHHFMKVYAYVKLIGEKELEDQETKYVLEAAAILHDIACPLCREKYGNTNGKRQEEEGVPLTRAFLTDFGLPEDFVERVVYLVGHHHTLTNVTCPEHRILLEADYLVNADEEHHTKEQIRAAESYIFRTKTGMELLGSIYLQSSEGSRI